MSFKIFRDRGGGGKEGKEGEGKREERKRREGGREGGITNLLRASRVGHRDLEGAVAPGKA